jgi:hypothetical protein
MDAMRRLAITIFVLGGLVAATAGWVAPARANCISSWSTSEYKSYSQVQADVRSQFGDVRILKVALCNQGSKSYFQIVVMDNKGVVRTLQISAHQNSFLPRSNGLTPSPSPGPTPPPPPPLPMAPPPQAK